MSSFAHPKPLIRSRNSTGGDKKLTLIAFKFDDSNGEQEFSLVHFTICNKYHNSRTSFAFYSQDLLTVIVVGHNLSIRWMTISD